MGIEIILRRKYYSNSPWKIKDACWEKYKNTVQEILDEQTPTWTPKEAYVALMSAINVAGSNSIPQRKTEYYSAKPRVFWWNSDCSKAVAKGRLALITRYRREQTLQRFLEYRRIDASTKRLLKKRKKEAWVNYCNRLNKVSNISEVWKTVRCLKNPKAAGPPVVDPVWIEGFVTKLAPPSCPEAPWILHWKQILIILC